MRYLVIWLPEHARRRVLSAVSESVDGEWSSDSAGDGQCRIEILIRGGGIQLLVDRVQSILKEEAQEHGWRMAVLPVEAAIFSNDAEDESRLFGRDDDSASREEIYQDVASGASITWNFAALSALSAVVAALGLNADSVPTVIGAMVIAPLLGPILAFAFGSALGDLKLMGKSALAAVTGVTIGLATSLALAFVIDVNTASTELTDRTVVGLDSVALALASGAAAALSIVSGLSSTLVGVMVAVALLPPSAAVALYIGAGDLQSAGKAGFLLALNVICVNLASQLVFFVKGVRPHGWLEQEKAARSRNINLVVWGLLLAGLVAMILLQP